MQGSVNIKGLKITGLDKRMTELMIKYLPLTLYIHNINSFSTMISDSLNRKAPTKSSKYIQQATITNYPV